MGLAYPSTLYGAKEVDSLSVVKLIRQMLFLARCCSLQVVGALNLSDCAARKRLNLDFLVFFSSASGVLGLAGDTITGFAAGESHSAAANSCLDGLAWCVRGFETFFLSAINSNSHVKRKQRVGLALSQLRGIQQTFLPDFEMASTMTEHKMGPTCFGHSFPRPK